MTRAKILGLCLAAAVTACGDDGADSTPAAGGAGGAGGSGGSAAVGQGGSGAVDPSGGTGAVNPAGGTGGGSGGSGASPPNDPTYSCPTMPYPEPPAAVITGDFPPHRATARIGDEDTDLLISLAPLPDESVAAIVETGTAGDSTFTLSHGNGTSEPIVSWPRQASDVPFVRADAEGNLLVAGTAVTPFDFGGETVGVDPSDSATGFIYLVKLDVDGAIAWSKSFPYEGSLVLKGAGMSPAGDIALAGSLTESLLVSGETIAPPSLGDQPLRASFVLRLDTEGELVFNRVFHATGTHNDPPALDGAGGTDGLGESSATDVAWSPDDAMVVTSRFTGGIVVGDERLPNDGDADGLVVKLDAAGETVWTKHLHGLIAETLPNPDGSGGAGGFIAAGVVGELRVDVGDDLTVAVTGPLQSRAVLESTVIDGGTAGFLTSVFDSDGTTGLAIPDGGVRVLSMGTETAIWDGKELFFFDAQGSVSASLLPGGEFVGTPVELVRTENLVLGGSFLGRLDLGSVYLDSAGCADAFVSQFRLDTVP